MEQTGNSVCIYIFIFITFIKEMQPLAEQEEEIKESHSKVIEFTCYSYIAIII